MASLVDIFQKAKILLYQNECLDLDHYYQEPYQDVNDEIKDLEFPFETDKSKKKRRIEMFGDNNDFTLFSYFMDGSRRTYKIGDIVLGGRKIFPVVVSQVRAGATERVITKKLQTFGEIKKKNLLLLTDKMNDEDFVELKQRVMKSSMAKSINLDVVTYNFNKSDDSVPVNAAIAKANAIMHGLEIDILKKMVTSDVLNTNKMLIVDGPLQFIAEDTGKPEFADLFYNVIGVSKSFDPMLPTSSKSKRGSTQIGAELIKLEVGERTPVFLHTNSKGRRFGFWYLRIRPKSHVSNALEGIVKIEKMATIDDEDGLKSHVVDNISLAILNECSPTCYGRDARWASHLYPVYLTESLIKSSFESDLVFISHFKRDF